MPKGVGESSGQPLYDFSEIGTPPPKWLGNKIRVDENNKVHIDTAIGKFFRSFGGAIYADASDAKEILEQISPDKGPADGVKAVKTAAVKILVLTGTQEDKEKYTNLLGKNEYKSLIHKREKKLIVELMKNPEIKLIDTQLSKLLGIPLNRRDPTDYYTDRLKALKEYGVDFETGKIDRDKYATALASRIIWIHEHVHGLVLKPDALKREILLRFDEIKKTEDLPIESITNRVGKKR